MKLAGFNFTKILVDKKSSNFKNLSIKSGIHIDEIKEITSPMKNNESFLSVKWKFEVVYEKDIAELKFEGNVLVSIEKEKAKKVLKQWKEKKVDEEFNLAIINVILKKCNIKAVQYEDDFTLPLHFKLPSLKLK